MGCEKAKLGGVSGEHFVRVVLSTFLPSALRCRFFAARIALSTFVVRIARGYVAVRVVLSTFLPPAVRGYVAARGARKIAWKDVTRRAKKYKAHDPELAAVRDVS